MELSVSMLCKLAAVVIMSPVFLIPGALVALIGGWLGQIYMKAQLSVKREMSNARAPVLGHFGAAIAGLSTFHRCDSVTVHMLTLSQRRFEHTVHRMPLQRRHMLVATVGPLLRVLSITSTGASCFIFNVNALPEIVFRWICIRIDASGAIFSTGLAAYLVYGSSFDASNTGFSLNMAGTSGISEWGDDAER